MYCTTIGRPMPSRPDPSERSLRREPGGRRAGTLPMPAGAGRRHARIREILRRRGWKRVQAPRFARSQSPFPEKPPGASRGDCGPLGERRPRKPEQPFTANPPNPLSRPIDPWGFPHKKPSPWVSLISRDPGFRIGTPHKKPRGAGMIPAPRVLTTLQEASPHQRQRRQPRRRPPQELQAGADSQPQASPQPPQAPASPQGSQGTSTATVTHLVTGTSLVTWTGTRTV